MGQITTTCTVRMGAFIRNSIWSISDSTTLIRSVRHFKPILEHRSMTTMTMLHSATKTIITSPTSGSIKTNNTSNHSSDPNLSTKVSSFALPSIFTKLNTTATSTTATSKPLLEQSLIDYPWLLSTSPNREVTPTFWNALKEKHYLTIATERTKDLLHHPVYSFPSQFLSDTSASISAVFSALSDPSTSGSVDSLEPLMVKGLANHFVSGFQSLAKRGHRTRFILHSTPKTRLKSIQLTYGPYPPPNDYVMQDWFPFIRLVIPRVDAEFESHPKQQDILKNAKNDGVFIRANVVIDCDIEFILEDVASGGMPLLRDRRSRFEMQFVSPHFTPWDDLFIVEGEEMIPQLTPNQLLELQSQSPAEIQSAAAARVLEASSTASADTTNSRDVTITNQVAATEVSPVDTFGKAPTPISGDMFKKDTMQRKLGWNWRVSDIDGLLGKRNTNNTERTS
ncbi:hypothetical protein BDV3_005361 [Batrachochytrium dendrobatidis]